MRGAERRSGELFSYVNLEARVRVNHPLRTILKVANAELETLSADFTELCSHTGRPSIAPEMLVRAMLLQAFYSIRSERQLMERLEFDLLFRCFVGIGVDDPAWDHSVFSKHRDRLLEGKIAAKFLAGILAQPQVRKLLSTEHFSIDGTPIEAWASMKSFKPRDSGDAGPPADGGRIEDGFGWIKTIGGLAKTRFIDRARTVFSFTFAAAAYNLIRIPKLIASQASP